MKHYLAALVVDIVVEPQRVALFLPELLAHPMGKAGQVVGVKMGGHAQVQISRLELFLNLIVDGVLNGFA